MEEPAARGPIGKIKLSEATLELQLWGELGIDRHRELRRVLRFVAGHAERRVIFDLATVASIDRPLLRSLNAAAARLESRGVTLELIPPASGKLPLRREPGE